MGARKQDTPRLAKLSQPRLHKPVRRERLFALLDARKTQPIIWVGGPAGAGKTTLVASYLEARKARTLWFQVDEGDKDPATFFHYLSELAQQTGAKAALPAFAADGDLGAFARYYFREFFRGVAAGSVLVFDNCQDAAGEAFHLVLRVACEQLPAGINLIALSRAVPPNELARLSAHGTLRQIDWSDLRLTADEAQALGASLGEQDANKILASYRVSDGWATGLMLALSHARGGINQRTASFNTREALFSYLLAEMLSRVSGDARRVLTHAALFPQVSVTLAEQISGSANAGAVLQELYRHQYLIDRKIDTELTYQFHDLFREFLLDELARSLAAPELAALRTRAAAMLETAGQINDAVQLFRQAQEWSAVARAIKQYGAALLDQGRWQTVNDWYDGAPALFDSDAWLVFWRGKALMVPDIARAKALLESAYQRFLAAQDDAGVLACVSALHETVFLLGEPLTAFLAWEEPLATALARRPSDDDSQLVIDAWAAYSDITMFASGNEALMEQARRFLDRTLTNPAASAAARIQAGLAVAPLAWFMADVEAAARGTKALANCVEREDINTVCLHWGHYWIALPEWTIGHHREAIVLFQRAIEVAAQFRFTSHDHTAHGYLAMAYHFTGMPQEAELTLRDARKLFDPKMSFHWGIFHNALAFDAYQRGDTEQALAHQKTCTQSLRAADSLGMLSFGWPGEAAYCAQTGRLDEACAVVAAARSATAKTIHRFADAAHCFVLAEVARQRGQREEALAHLREALGEARNPIKAGLLFSLTRCLPRLLALAIEEGIETGVVRELIKRWNLLPDAATQDRWPWPVKIYALGTFHVVVDDQPLPSKGKSHFKVLALLKAVIAAGARQVSAQTLAEWLWPDVDGDAAASNLKGGVMRLRKLLGREDAVVFHDGKVSLNERVCWLDVWGFEHSVAKVGEYSADETIESGSSVYTPTLYRGDLLPQDDAPWILTARERLRAKFQRAAIDAGKRHESAGEYEAAAALYERCLEADPSAEALYRQLMLCLKNAGRYTEALDAFKRCSSALEAQVSKETRQVYETLLRVQQ